VFVSPSLRLDRKRFATKNVNVIFGRKTAGAGNKLEELSGSDVAGMIGFIAGTTLIAAQTAAPTGWTKGATHNDKMMRLVTGSVTTGGSAAFATVMANQIPQGQLNSTAVATTEIAAHGHTFIGATGVNGAGGFAYGNTSNPIAASTTGGTSGGGGHLHSASGSTRSFAVTYVDAIIISKN
jgi:hypothetical protein